MTARNRRRRASRRSGFTLVELIISLVAGLIVAMAVMGVSKEATNTFHEEVRVAGAEMSLRIAMERIRLDLSRAAFMGTGNILGDPLIARAANYVGITPTLSNFTGGTVPYSFGTLSGIALHPDGATVLTDGAAKTQLAQVLNNLTPDSMDIGGNFSSSDEYAASIVWNPSGAGTCSGAAAISLEMTTPAGWRIRNAESAGVAAGGTYKPGQALHAAFHPGAGTKTQYLLKLTDQSGHVQYLLGCAGDYKTGTFYNDPGAGAVPTALIYLSQFSKVLSTNDTGGVGGIAGFAAGWVTVSPVEVVRWDIVTPAQLATQVSPAVVPASYLYNQTQVNLANPNLGVDLSDFLLTRSYLDFSTACGNATPCPIDADTVEVIAEYAVDLKFGLTADTYINSACTGPTAFPCSMAAPTYTSNTLLNYPMDSMTATSSPAYAAQVGAYIGSLGPQRIRDVQVRIGIRSPFGDRAVGLTVPSNTAVSSGYLFRYQLDATASHYNPLTPFARLRESTTEVSLVNQARIYW